MFGRDKKIREVVVESMQAMFDKRIIEARETLAELDKEVDELRDDARRIKGESAELNRIKGDLREFEEFKYRLISNFEQSGQRDSYIGDESDRFFKGLQQNTKNLEDFNAVLTENLGKAYEAIALMKKKTKAKRKKK